MELLKDCIQKIKIQNKLETKSIDEYVKYIYFNCKYIPIDVLEHLIIEACNIYEDKMLYDKPVTYLRAIIINLFKNRQSKVERELKEFGSLPPLK